MNAQSLPQLTPQDYWDGERQSEIKHEFLNGLIFDMAGASRSHNLIIANVVGELRTQLKGRRCEVYPNDMRVHIPRSGLYTYPDAVVVCGTPQFDETLTDSLLNPTALFEALSPSTEAYDRGAKFGHYRKIAALRHYVLLAQDAPHIECYTRQDESRFWYLSEADGLDAEIALPEIACVLKLAEVYDKVEFVVNE